MWRTTLQSPRRKQVRKSRLRLRLAGIIFLFVFALASAAFLSRLDIFTIKTVRVSENGTPNAQAILAIVRQAMKGSYFWLLPKNNAFLYPKKNIEAQVLAAFPRVAEVNTKMDETGTLSVSLREREPAALWCGEGASVDTPDVGREERNATDAICYFVDESGYIFSEAPSFSGTVFFKYYTLLSPGKPVGQYIMNVETFKKLTNLLDSFRNLGLVPTSLVREDGDFTAFLEDGAKIIWSGSQDFKDVFDNLQLLLSAPDFVDESHKQPLELEYIDLRFGNKIFYKWQ
jgi:hypothetical protein